MSELANISISVPSTTEISRAALAKVSENLPAISEKIKIFDRNNSQTTISLTTLTMLNGQSPMRLLRQVMAEIDRRKMALAESQVNHAKLSLEIENLERAEPNRLNLAELRLKRINIDSMEGKINGCIKDIATLIDAYENIKSKHGIVEWDEESFEAEEKKHHIRRGFELLYRNLIQNSRPHDSTIEYLQQYGVHIQAALVEVAGYIDSVNEKILKGQMIGGSDIEDFLDGISEKYKHFADETSERLFGKKDFLNKEYMMRLEDSHDN
jgi:hypothetical protein